MRRRVSRRVPAAAWAGIVVILERMNVRAEKLLHEGERLDEALDALLAFLRQPGPIPRITDPVAEPPAPR